MSKSNSITKVMAAGFKVFRKHEESRTISVAAGPGQWRKYHSDKTVSGLNRAWDDIMKDPKNIEM